MSSSCLCASYPGYVLEVGSSGNSVQTAQYYLQCLSEKYPTVPKIAADGVYGSKTQGAVYMFQQATGLTMDGKIGPATWSMLCQKLCIEGFLPTSRPYAGTVMQQGSTGNNVRDVQLYLSSVANIEPAIAKLKVDGQYGSLTASSVRTFQALHMLSVDGKVGPNTYSKLRAVYDSL